jgi:putative transposase
LLGISDGAAGLTGAFDQAFPRSLRQRCLVRRARNVLAKVSTHDQPQVKADLLGHLRRRRRRAW